VKPKSEAVSFFSKCLHLGDFFFKTAERRKKGKNVNNQLSILGKENNKMIGLEV
jgi:hypothetical protein